MSDSVMLYNLRWSRFEHPVSVEATMVRRGGSWKKRDGSIAGNGLEFHFKRFISLVWKDHLWHRWNEMELDAYLNYRIIGEMGPASSGKTHSAAIHNLADYYIWSECTTVLVSSTEREMLEMRIWGEMKKLHREAQAKFPQIIPGKLIESRQRIVSTMDAAFAEGRDFRNGVCGVPVKKGGNYQGLGCFPAGTMVDTPHGRKAIENIREGDLVNNAIGVGRVRRTMVREASQLVRVHFGGRHFDCTPEHLIFTDSGWVKAIDLLNTHTLISPDDSLRILQGEDDRCVPASKVLQDGMQEQGAVFENKGDAPTGEALHNLPIQIHGGCRTKILFDEVSSRQMETGPYQEVRTMQEAVCSVRHRQAFLREILCGEMEMEPAEPKGLVCKNGLEEGRHKTQPNDSTVDCQWLEEEESRDDGRENYTTALPGSCVESDPSSGEAGLFLARHKTGSGNRRPTSPIWKIPRTGQIKGSSFETLRVDFVEVLKPGSEKRYGKSGRGYQVYNLEVTWHPSYFVNGILVHNSFAGIKNRRVRMIADELHLCPRVFIDAISNLNKNPDFKCIGLGNPKDTTDALGILCEPAAHLGGWDGGIDQANGAKTWPTRFDRGICIQLDGEDSPNLDGHLGIPLITQEAIDADIQFYGKDSLQFTMMNKGRMPRGQGLRRVITRQMCLKFGAREEAVWKDDNLTKIGFCDAAYGSVGGDRCVFGWLQFGNDVNGRQILELKETMLVPVSVNVDETPEDQIANFCKAQAEQRGIPPTQFGFDSTGRGSLMAAFARIWSAYVVGVEFGGKPSERPVTWIPLAQKVLCCDYYSKFVSELWYSVRLTIESRQFRGMTEEMMMEGCMREWGLVSSNKVEVEPKDKMKLKTGRSPDLFDALVTGVELARRHGFVISLALAKSEQKKDDTWKDVYRERMARLEANHRLNYST